MANHARKVIIWFVALAVETLLILILSSLFGDVANLMTNVSTDGIIGVFVIVGIVVVTFIIAYLTFALNKKSVNIEFCFAHLTIHYSKRGTQKYITNNETNQAYWVSDLLEIEAQKHTIPTHYHKDKKEFQKYFAHANERDPLMKELGLVYTINKTFCASKKNYNSHLFNMLKDHNLEDLQIVHIYPWYYNIISTNGKNPPNKRLLLKVSTKQAYYAPPDDYELWENHIIERQIKAFKIPLESLKKWCDDHGYHLDPSYFSEKQFLQEIAQSDKIQSNP